MSNSTEEIRRSFLDYFSSVQHEELPSSPLIPQDDPTLLFTNAGMVQFKNIFTGKEKSLYQRATTSQKCLRAGGKHNDLENVGYTARHHTFFEMLGNFSFGDYFKESAIDYAWNLVTKIYELKKEQLLITVYEQDEEAFNLWKKISGLPEEKIIKINTSDNFWSMGDTGPCGPCSEIFYDHGPHIKGGIPGSKEQDGDRYIEIWNLVFMQYEMMADGTKSNLPKPSIDTGMGLERMAAILQGVNNNYDIDLFKKLINSSIELSDIDSNAENLVSHRVISDHLRASAFLIADGILPSNEGRGYVLRRIMRRAMRHVHKLGIKDLHMYKLVDSLKNIMGRSFDELKRAQPLIENTLMQEEEKFRETLERGIGLLNKSIDNLRNSEPLSGEVAFKLYDTYGFPVDLTADILRGHGKELDYEGFKANMNQQKDKARKSWSGSGEQETSEILMKLKEKHNDSEFVGYEKISEQIRIISIIKGDEELVEALIDNEVSVITDKTPFYGESGGQEGDKGFFEWENGSAKVVDTIKVDDIIIHSVKVLEGVLKVNSKIMATVDLNRRDSLKIHHSATHLLHQSLRRHVGSHVTQKGSLVAEDKLRFDISHNKPINKEIINIIEEEINEQIRINYDVSTSVMSIKEAQNMGALALFGEKYGEKVRVVSMGRDLKKDIYSTELCGGTHVNRSGDIGAFKIISESALGSGVRRIEAVAGNAAIKYFQSESKILEKLSSDLKVNNDKIIDRVNSLLDDKRKLEKKIIELNKTLNTSNFSNNKTDYENVGDLKVISKIMNDLPSKELKGLVDAFKKELKEGIVVLISITNNKASLVVGVTQGLVNAYDAVDLTKIGVEVLGGKGGGGRPDLAQGGGPNYKESEASISAILNKIKDG